LRYEGPIYRPPSEAGSLLIQATVGCPHNKCAFCMVYKKGPPFKIRPVPEVKADLDQARLIYGPEVKSVFYPAGNTIAMSADQLAEICRHARRLFPTLERQTVYGSAKYLVRKNPAELVALVESGLTRIHLGLESGDDVILAVTKKGADAATQVRACRAAIEAGLEVSVYVVLGLGGRDRTREHAQDTAEVLNRIRPHFVRLRTFVPKTNTLMLHQVRRGLFRMLSPHGVLQEIITIIKSLDFPTQIVSDHYTNYLDVTGRLPQDRPRLLALVADGLRRPETDFRPFFIGTE